MKLLFESIKLDENKMVTFNNEMYPKFGWCVFLVGGPGSGKGSVYKQLVPIDGQYMNVDDLKENTSFWNIQDRHSVTPDWKEVAPYKTVIAKECIKQGLINSANELDNARTYCTLLKNPSFTGILHQMLKPLSKNYKRWSLKYADNETTASQRKWMLKDTNSYFMYDRDRLPNLILDIVGSDFEEDILDVVNHLEPKGYKFALIWVSSDVNKAIINNANRNRTVSKEVILSGHSGVIKSIEKIFDTGLINRFSSCWVVDTDIDISKMSKAEYHDLSNCYEIPCDVAGLDTFLYNPHYKYSQADNGKLNIRDRIQDQKNKLDSLQNE